MNERYDFRTKRLFVNDALVQNQAITTDRAQANYLLNVLRLKADDSVLLFNGRDGEWRASIVPTGRKAC
ncbi:MAG: RNA methyltransferase PUA domain-containing protein, partial [Hyphomicrobiales bacterium]